MTVVLATLAALLVGLVAGYAVRRALAGRRLAEAEGRARKLVADAELEAEDAVRKAMLEVKEEIAAARREAEEDVRHRREETRRREARTAEREERAERKYADLRKGEEALGEKDRRLDRAREELARMAEEHRRQLEHVARMTAQDAKDALMEQLVTESKREAMAQVREIEQRAREEAQERARKIVTIAIQRVAAEQTAESTVSVFTLPSDDLKGRIIGREGRNIRAFEALTGVNLIIDDTPEAVVLSSFDPVRREVARLTLDKLVQDGRIHPARIEEMHERSQREVEEEIKRAGEWAVSETGITEIHPEMIRVLGRLQFRTSYGQNVLKHLVESAHIAGVMAAELGIEPALVKRGALMHDIESHHGEVEQRTIEAVLAQTADAISGSRPGARRESIEQYVKRLERLEEICTAHVGVQKVFAMQAGREVRVMVSPEEVDDLASQVLARDIAKQVEEELQYPGQIKITVVRELRSVEVAK
jgi:ribonuclease Y